ncbi:MAG: GNAT family N-acetyltransferase [Myxococcota bacterium]
MVDVLQHRSDPQDGASGSASVLAEGEGWRVRLATPADDAALRDLVRRVPFGAPTPFVEDRGDDFFALRRLRTRDPSVPPDVFLVEDDGGAPVGCLSVAARPGRHASDVLSVGHIGDVRMLPEHRGGRVFPGALRAALEHVRDRRGAEVFQTAVPCHDYGALDPFLQRRAARYEQPMAQVMTLMDLVLVPLQGRARAEPERMVQRASDLDLEPLAAFMSRHQTTRRFGEDVTPQRLRQLVARLPDFGVDRFFVVRESGARIVGCAAALDLSSVRRFVPLEREGEARLDALRFRLRGLVRGHDPLPEPGVPADVVFLGGVEVSREDPGILEDLLLGMHAELGAAGHEWMAVSIPRGSGLEEALDPLPTWRIPFAVLAVTLAGTPWNNVDFRAARVGFEAAFG